MASNVLSNDPYLSPGERRARSVAKDASILEMVLRPLASLKLTVVLFALAIIIILAGTVAQVNEDVWTVVHHYFRSFFTTIDFQIFFPRTWHVWGWIPFPGGWLIGAAVDRQSARGPRTAIQAAIAWHAAVGRLAVIAAGIVVMWGVIAGAGALGAVTAAAPGCATRIGKLARPSRRHVLWNGMKLGLAGLLACNGLFRGDARLEPPDRARVALHATVVEGTMLAWLLYHSDFVPDASSMRILWQLVQGGFVGLVLLAGCALAFKKRAGIVLIHAGIALMMFNELYVGMTSTKRKCA